MLIWLFSYLAVLVLRNNWTSAVPNTDPIEHTVYEQLLAYIICFRFG